MPKKSFSGRDSNLPTRSHFPSGQPGRGGLTWIDGWCGGGYRLADYSNFRSDAAAAGALGLPPNTTRFLGQAKPNQENEPQQQ